MTTTTRTAATNADAAPLRAGYKASAEQFSHRELVNLTIAAEEHGPDSV